MAKKFSSKSGKPTHVDAFSKKKRDSSPAPDEFGGDPEDVLSGPALKRMKKHQAKTDAVAKYNKAHSLILSQGKQLLSHESNEQNPHPKIFVVLEKAYLELVQISKGGGFELLNGDDHKTVMKKSSKADEIQDARPDICHQMLMSLLDSPLNKKGRLQLYIHTRKNVLIEVHPSLRIPRTFKRFCGLMVELLQRGKIRAKQSNELLMKVVANPVEKYLPAGGRRIGMSVKGVLTDFREYVNSNLVPSLAEKNLTLNVESEKDKTDSETVLTVDKVTNSAKLLPITFVVGAVAHCDPVNEEKFGGEYVEEQISVSSFGLSGANVCSKICHEFENLYKIL